MTREQPQSRRNHDETDVVRIVLPFKDQKSTDQWSPETVQKFKPQDRPRITARVYKQED